MGLFLTLVCLSFCLSIFALLVSPQGGFWILQRQAPGHPYPRLPPFSPPQGTSVLPQLPTPASTSRPTSADLQPLASLGVMGGLGPAAPLASCAPLLCPQPTYHLAACSSPPRMRSVVLPRPCSRPLMIYLLAPRTSFCPREPDPARHLPPELLPLAALGHTQLSIHVLLLQTSEAGCVPDPGLAAGAT